MKNFEGLNEQKMLEEIERKAKSFINGSCIDYKGFDSYLRELAADSNLQIIDIESGELMSPAFEYILKVKMAKNAFFEKKNMVETGMGRDNRGHFFNIDRKASLSLAGKLTFGEREKIMKWALDTFKHYDFEGNKAKWRTEEELAKIWGVGKVQAKKVRLKLMNNNIAEKRKNENKEMEFRLSPHYVFQGKVKENSQKVYYKKMFAVMKQIEKEEKRYEKATGEKLAYGALGILHSILPYFHKDLCYMVENPEAAVVNKGETLIQAFDRERKAKKAERKLIHMSLDKISEVIAWNTKLNKNTVHTYFEILNDAGAILFTVSKRKTRVLVHPDLLLSVNLNENDPFIIMLKGLIEI